MSIYEHPAYKYAFDVVNNNIKLNNTSIRQGKYIIKQCRKFLDDLENNNCKYFIDEDELERITNLTKLINMADGLRAGLPVYESLVGFQWFFLVNMLCWKYKDNTNKRRYETSVLLIARKSGKSMLIGLIFLILMIIEPKYSQFFSVAPDRELSKIVKEEVAKLLESSPALTKRFKIRNTDIFCNLTSSKFVPLANSVNRMDGRKANVFVADEVGALKNRYPISAMRSSQMNMLNRTGVLISTAYESQVNPMVEEVEYCEKVLDGLIEDDTVFALLYKPDNTENWTDDLALYQANPLAIDVPENLEELFKMRKKAIEMPSETTNFKTKHLNIFVSGKKEEVFIDIKDLKKCEIDSYDWTNKDVVLSFDLALSGDNTAVSILTYDYYLDKYVAQSWGFIPASKIEIKTQEEKVPYNEYIRRGWCFGCGNKGIIDYGFIESFILSIESKLGCKVRAVGYDKYNASSTVSKLENEGLDCTEVAQGYMTLHPACKLMKESVLNEKFAYVKNDLFVLNVANAREITNAQQLTMVAKKASKGKIDLLASLLNSFALIEQIEETSVYETGGITFI
ncbi:terminase large subunit [Romboutsia sp. 1001216sp1]|uniref:terminase large subunit n=1 Tax=unclassified Romboutsia TaxID=2626894 RepID=UPI0018A92CD7|nr:MULTISPECIES: terminase TerL endonuclease subunit [unclassified Romboutsia]MDB8794281.1 terminase large subunit [Romboutsia sp. 1001216sp1]MDB8796450.1 terminase large subunit [Romboutsia sp. 1001216sp1]MDB8797797.1 terminase large subunit [Romboutsia sp. 1001216sp1]